MRLSTLHPEFYSAHGGDTKGAGLLFDCPCGCGTRCHVDFKNPVQGEERATGWTRTGTTAEDLTLKPSLHRNRIVGSHVPCGWHGWITDGEVTSV